MLVMTNSKGEGFSSQDKNMPTDAAGFNGSNNIYSNETTNLLFDAYLNYATESGESNLSVTAGHSYQSFEYDNSSTASVEYLNPDGSVNSGSSTTNSLHRYIKKRFAFLFWKIKLLI